MPFVSLLLPAKAKQLKYLEVAFFSPPNVRLIWAFLAVILPATVLERQRDRPEPAQSWKTSSWRSTANGRVNALFYCWLPNRFRKEYCCFWFICFHRSDSLFVNFCSLQYLIFLNVITIGTSYMEQLS